MISNDFIMFLPEIMLLLYAMFAIGLAAFSKERFKLSLTISLLVVLFFAFIILKQQGSVKEVYAFSDLFVCNGFTRFFKLIIIGLFFLIQIAIYPYLEKEGLAQPEFYALMTFACVGSLLMISSHHYISLFMSAELAAFSVYLMVAFNRENLFSTEAALKYFILGSVGSAFFLLGVSFIYGSLGTLTYSSFALLNSLHIPYVNTGIVLILMAFAFKLSLAPFHMWTPDVYQGAPTPVVLFISTILKVAAIAVLTQLLLELFYAQEDLWKPILIGLSSISMLVGSFAALFQRNIKRIIAYSTISHMGYAILGFLTFHLQGISALLIYLTIYVITTAGIFTCLLCLRCHGKGLEDLEDFRGLGTEFPLVAASLMIFLFSLAGMPPLAGFFAKLTIFSALLEGDYTALAILGVLTSVVAASFYLKIIKMMYFESPQGGVDSLVRLDSERSKATLIVMFFFLSIVLGYAFMRHALPAQVYKAVKVLVYKTLR